MKLIYWNWHTINDERKSSFGMNKTLCGMGDRVRQNHDWRFLSDKWDTGTRKFGVVDREANEIQLRIKEVLSYRKA